MPSQLALGAHCPGHCPTGQQALALDGHDCFESAEAHRVRGKRPGLRLRQSHPRASSQSLLQVPLRMSHPQGDSGWASSGSSPGEQRGRARSPDSRPESSLPPWPTFCWPPGRGFPVPTCSPQKRKGRVVSPLTVQHWQETAGSQQLGQLRRAGGQREGQREKEELVACDTRRWGCAVVRHEPQGGDRGGNTRGGGSS